MKFKGCYRVENIAPEATFLLTERSATMLSSPIFQKLATLIDEDHTTEEIVKEMQLSLVAEDASDEEHIYAAAQVHYALMQLEQKGYIVKYDDALPPDLAIFCEHLNIEPQDAHSRLQTTTVGVSSLGSNLPVSQFKTALEELHIRVTESDADIEIILADDYLQDGLASHNQKMLGLSRPWILIKPVGTIIWLGPIFQPGKTGCWHCLVQRLQNNKPVESFIQRQRKISSPLIPPLASLPATLQTALGMAATEVFKWIVQGGNKRLEGVLVTYDTLSLETQNHLLTKRPQCPTCGESLDKQLNRSPIPIVLGHRKKTCLTGGGHRLSTPEDTLNKYQKHISPITGVVRELKKLERDSLGLTHSYVAKHHFATLFDDIDALRHYTIGRSGGTAQSDAQAKCSSFCEAVERYSGVFQGNEIRQRASYLQMGDIAIHPNACMNFSQAQYQSRHEWNVNCTGLIGNFQRVPEPFDEEQEIDWTPVWSLTEKKFKHLPTQYCYYGYPASFKPGFLTRG